MNILFLATAIIACITRTVAVDVATRDIRFSRSMLQYGAYGKYGIPGCPESCNCPQACSCCTENLNYSPLMQGGGAAICDTQCLISG